MQNNVGNMDKVIRLVAAAILAYLVISNQLAGNWKIVAIVAAIILAVTALVGKCGIYKLFGINTCKIDTQNKTN